jgi:HAE1 family hydrophobic/amphiphilic exporter-1
MGLTKAAINRPVFVLMLMLAAFFLGQVAYKSMRVEENPDVSFGVVSIITVYPGANPDTVNNLVSRRIEEAVSGVNGIREVISTSQQGLSSVVVQLEIGVDTNAALNDVRSKVDAILNDLPQDVLKPTINKIDTASTPVLVLAFSSPTLNSRELRDLLDDKIADRYAQIPGVAAATVQGGDVREIQVRIKRDKLMAYGLGIADVQRAIQAANQDIPGGRLLTQDQEYTLRVYNQVQRAEDLENLVFTVSNPANPRAKGATVRLKDVADIVDTVRERETYARLDGKDSIVLNIIKTREGNAVDITARADAETKLIQSDFPEAQLSVVKTQEQAKIIKESLLDLNIAIYFGIFLVTAIVFVFLHNFRGTLIVALAIPTSIFFTYIALYLGGFTINNLSMLALSLAVGVLVDDAIVVIENIYRHLRMGEEPREAALNGRSEIGLAAIAITMADVVVFLPIAFMPGIVGQFFKPLAVGFVFATLFSLLVSFTLTPMLASRWYKAGEDMEHPQDRFARWFERQFGKLESAYRRALEWSLNHRWFVFTLGNLSLFAVFVFIAGASQPSYLAAAMTGQMLVAIAVAVGAIVMVANGFRGKGWKPKYVLSGLAFGLMFPVSAMLGHAYGTWKGEAVFKFQFLPESDSGRVEALIELPPGANLAETQKVVDVIEKRFMDHPDVHYVLSTVGTQGTGTFTTANSGSNYAAVAGTLYEKTALLDSLNPFAKHEEKLRSRSDKAVAADLVKAVGRIPGAKVRITAAQAQGFGSAIQMSFVSEDRKTLLDTVNKVQQGLAAGAVKGVINPDISSKPGKPEITILPDPWRMADAGVTAAEVGQAVRTLYQGNDDSKLRVAGKEYDIRVMMDYEDRDNLSLLNQVPIAFNQGQPIFVGSLAKVDQQPGVDKITRRNRAEEIQVTADLLPGYAAGSVQQEIDNWMKDQGMIPANVKYRPLGQADAQAREGGYLVGAILTGLVLVYMLLASLYDNLLYPFIIQLAQPQAMVGALLALVFTDKPLNIVGMIGIIALIGLVGKNAILLVDYTNTLRTRGRNRHDALVEAGPTRLRPILMTTLALVLGMLPVALAIGRGSEFRETIGISIIGGISLSTLLTLLVIPCSYTIFDDLSNGFGKWMRKLRRKPEPENPEAALPSLDPTTVDTPNPV